MKILLLGILGLCLIFTLVAVLYDIIIEVKTTGFFAIFDVIFGAFVFVFLLWIIGFFSALIL